MEKIGIAGGFPRYVGWHLQTQPEFARLDVRRLRRKARCTVPASMVRRALAATGIREATECNVVALEVGGEVLINPPPETRLPAGAELILIGTTDAERRFVQKYGR